MKVQYLLTPAQISAISALAHIDGTTSSEIVNGVRLIEYDIVTDKIVMLESLLGQKGSIVKDKPRWLSNGDTYYYIDNDGDILRDRWDIANDANASVNVCRHDIGNIFKTESDAYFEKERLKVLNQLKRLSDDDQEWDNIISHYYITYNLELKIFDIWSLCFTKWPCAYSFKSKASAENAIKTIGEDRLKKYVFNIKEN